MSATLKAPHFPAQQSDGGWIARIAGVLRGTYAGRHATKTIARDADANSRTAESWLHARTAPRSPELLELMAANEELETQILALIRERRRQRNAQR